MDVLKSLPAIALLVLSQTGCQLTYYARNLSEGMRILWSQKPVNEILEDPSTTQELRHKLELAQEANTFSVQALGLNKTENYQKYVNLNRPYVSYIVQAAPAYQLEPYKWWFPFIGSVPYKGFFTPAEAEAEANKFDPESYDTAVRGVAAFSTLGWLRDPLLSSMMSYDDFALVELVIHESVHATVYIKNQAQFNEQLATYIGQVGAGKFFASKEGPESLTLSRAHMESQDEKVFRKFLNEEIAMLKKWYEDNKGTITKEQKRERLSQIRTKYFEKIRPMLHQDRYKNLMASDLNNAHLIAFSTYHKDLSIFEQLHQALENNPKAMIQFCKNLQRSKDPYGDVKKFLSSDSNSF